MTRIARGVAGSLILASAVLLLAGCVAIDAGHEGVLVEQPFFFGHGGVDPVPAKTGRVGLHQRPRSSMWMSGRFNIPNTSISFQQKTRPCLLMRFSLPMSLKAEHLS